MRDVYNLAILTMLLSPLSGYGDSRIYPQQDFYNRNIELPIDHEKPEEGLFTLYYQLSSNFDFNQPTIFFFQDSQQNYGEPGKVDELAQRYQFDESFNVVRYQHRGRKYSNIDTRNEDGSVNWKKVYRFLSSHQVVEDIERVRQDLFKEHPDSKIFLYGRSGGGYLAQEYLARYSKNVERAFIRAAPNPVIMENLGFIESKHLLNALNAVDPALHAKLKELLEGNTVPRLSLLWMLLRLGYGHQDPGPLQAAIINELHANKRVTYDSYMQRRGFDYEKLRASEGMIKQMGFGMYLRPIECDGLYLLGKPPEYVDPIYDCFRDFSAPIIQLIEEGEVTPPTFPSLETFREIETEVFYLAGKNDHMSPFQIGIELGKFLKKYELFIADDNHLFLRHEDCLPKLRNAFFKSGIGSEELGKARKSAQCTDWRPE
jgi:pimeloyl-ACP methyl ester carboxylesterase